MLQQKDGEISLADVRILLDQLIHDFGEDFEHYLSADAEIVFSPTFERAIVKKINGESLSYEEVEALATLREQSDEVTVEECEGEDENSDGGNYAALALKRAKKKRKISPMIQYVDFDKLPVSSNIVERFFSQVKLVLTPLRNSLQPSTLESIMFLKMNRHLWGKLTVQEALRRLKR